MVNLEMIHIQEGLANEPKIQRISSFLRTIDLMHGDFEKYLSKKTGRVHFSLITINDTGEIRNEAPFIDRPG